MTKQRPGKPQQLDYEPVPTVQTFFEVRSGSAVVRRIIHLIAPAVHVVLRMVASFVARANRGTERGPR